MKNTKTHVLNKDKGRESLAENLYINSLYNF